MIVKDDNVFLVTGFIGEKPDADNLFMGYCVAVDAVDAGSYMQGMIEGLRISGVNSLTQIRAIYGLLDRVKAGTEQAPITPRMAGA